MKKLYTIEEALYTVSPIEDEIEIQKLEEHVETQLKENKIKLLVNEVKLNEDCEKMNVKVNKDEFKALFGPNAKPRKGDYVSLVNTQKKYRIKKSKKFTAKKKGKGYKLSLKKVQ